MREKEQSRRIISFWCPKNEAVDVASVHLYSDTWKNQPRRLSEGNAYEVGIKLCTWHLGKQIKEYFEDESCESNYDVK